MDQLIECASLGIIQDIPYEMTKLKNQIADLVGKNKTLRNILIFTGLAGGIAITYIIYKKYNTDDKRI